MKSLVLKMILLFICFIHVNTIFAWENMPLPQLHVEGRYLKDNHGNMVNLHGFAQTYSPWFNEQNSQWNNYDVDACLTYNQGLIDGILNAGWKMNFIRLHMDPYWSNTPGVQTDGEHDISAFDFDRFKTYLDQVFIPMAEYAITKGLYVVMRPPGVSPENIAIGDEYQQYLLKVWGYVAQHPKLRNHPDIMFELANEPIHILGPDGTYGAGSQGHFDNLKTYFQAIVDTMRTSADNILWVPGLGYQSQYAGFAVNPVEGDNIGYAVHVYPGWFNSGQGYEPFQSGWDKQVQPIADIAPIMVTEMDWAPEKYNASWGKEVTGIAGGDGFGANFKKIVDDCGNVSWLLFTSPDLLDDFVDKEPAEGENYVFLNDPEACPWPIFHWYQEYANINVPKPDFAYIVQSDNGNGTFSNPVINGDFPDPLVVLVDDTYYLVSTNTNANPDKTILESRDLVNWSYSDVSIENIPLENNKLVNDADVHSGSLIETNNGEWWAIISYDQGALGSVPQLLPVSWNGTEPIIDETVIDGTSIQKPDVGRDYPLRSIETNDVFRHYILGKQWSWKQQPDDSKWSLMERAGYLRLQTTGVTDNFANAQNILSQRIFAYSSDVDHSFGTIKMEIDHMIEGDISGLSVFQDNYGFIGVQMIGGEKKVVTSVGNVLQTGATIVGSEIYLRVIVNFNTSKAELYYSFDNSTYTKSGVDVSLEKNPEIVSGYRFGIFNYATVQTGGYVDVDWFTTESEFEENIFYPDSFESYSKESLTLSDVYVEGGDQITILSGSNTMLDIRALFEDGHTEVIREEVECLNNNPEVITYKNGIITSIADGEAILEFSYVSPLGEKRQLTINITSTTFPLTNALFNPDIWEDGTFDGATNTLHTGQWGFGGWQYSGIDLSGYKYIIARLGAGNPADVAFNIYDGSSYWGSPASYKFGNNQEVVVMLEHAEKNDGTMLNPDHIYIAGFWSDGSNPFVIDTVFLSNSSEYDPPTIYIQDINSSDITALNDFYYVMGEGPSVSQQVIISGAKLTNDITITAPANYEISLEENQGYTKSLTLSQIDGLVSETQIYIRLVSDLDYSEYNENIELSSPGAFNKTIVLSGIVEDKSGIDDIPGPNATVMKKSYYTLTGRELADIEHRTGIFIVKEIYSDGAIVFTKIFKKSH